MNRNDASEATVRTFSDLIETLPKNHDEDFEAARRGFVDTLPDAEIPNAWSMAPYRFEQDARPATVNPSLWRQSKLNAINGLFEVTAGIYQVRGFDLSNITFIEGETGFVVVDPLVSAECAAAALRLMRRNRGDKPVTAVIYTHSHVDHFGGIAGVASAEDVANGLQIVAPDGFLKAAISENVLLGNVMGRRATYMYGSNLPRDGKGHVDCGLGKALSTGSSSLLPPTHSITRTGETMILDGIEIAFQLTPDTEAPAEMNFFFPRHRALCLAENCTCHLHNLYTLRGAQVRDARNWSHYIEEARGIFCEKTEVAFASHHWPTWGKDSIDAFLRNQRDLYKYIHDQTLRMANHGSTPLEIAEELALPPTLAAEWYTRGYYGTLNHNAKAVYQRYLGWYDGNPANLHKLPPVEAGRRYVDLAGGADALLAKARNAYEAGDYRWVAEIVNHLVFADPSNEEARHLQADALEQMGYQAESGPWRDNYLTGAMELRSKGPPKPNREGIDSLDEIPVDFLLEALSVRLNGPKAANIDIAFVLVLDDTEDRFTVTVENAVLHHAKGGTGREAKMKRSCLLGILGGRMSPEDAVKRGLVTGEGARNFIRLASLLDTFDPRFAIVTP